MHRSAIFLLCCIVPFWLTGCGGLQTQATTVTSTPASAASNLAGNWLLYGTLPAIGAGLSTQPGFGISFDAVGNQLVAGARILTTCGTPTATFGATFGGGVIGGAAVDGLFTVTSPSSSGGFPTLTITGSIPSFAPASSWSGTYTLTATPNPLTNIGCTINQSGAFTATPVQDIKGVYTGAATLSISSGLGNPASLPISMTLSLQQGAPLNGPLRVASANSRLALGGTVQLQGFSCFSKGVISTTLPSTVDGGPFTAEFVMDDGSPVEISGSIENVAASRLDISLINITSGSCKGIYGFGSNPLVLTQ